MTPILATLAATPRWHALAEIATAGDPSKMMD